MERNRTRSIPQFFEPGARANRFRPAQKMGGRVKKADRPFS
jgi:hypothetical protein